MWTPRGGLNHVQYTRQLMFSGADHQEDMPVWEVMQTKEFYTFTVPFDIPGSTKVSVNRLCMEFYTYYKVMSKQ